MTHRELVSRAVRWLLGRGGCGVAFSEFATATTENPDAIGWHAGWSTLIECKASRADFLRDRKKVCRLSAGMGKERYYLVPAGLIREDELPAGWGLLYAYDRHVRVIRKSSGFTKRNHFAEVRFLVSMLRRVEIRAVALRAQTASVWPVDFLNQWIKETAA